MKHPIPEVPHDAARDARLATYRDLLLRWNANINLVSARTAAEVDHRHVADSLQLLPLLPGVGPIAAMTARALAPLDNLLALAAPHLATDGIAIFPKGRNAEQELTSASAHWHFTTERFDSRTDPEATILRLSEIRRARDD